MSLCENLKKLDWNDPNEKINIPTKFSAQILTNVKSLLSNIEDYLLTDDLIKIFKNIIKDIFQYYLPIFENRKDLTETARSR